MNWWRSFKYKLLLGRQLSLRDWLALVEAWWGLLGFYLALRWVRFERLMAAPHPTSGKITDSVSTLAFARREQRLVGMAARLHLLSMTCLPQAFTLRWMLGRRGIPAQVRIGANKGCAGVHAHAWVEIEGQAIESEEITDRFKPLD